MSYTVRQKRKAGGKRIQLFVGLADDVYGIIGNIDGVSRVTCPTVRGYHGERRIKLSWGNQKPFIVVVCDAENGERHLYVDTIRHGAVARILRKRLTAQGLPVVSTAALRVVKKA